MTNVLLGGAIGDALGVFAESKPADYPPLLAWDQKSFLGSEYHGLKPGNFSDDTQLSIEISQSLISNNGFNPEDLAARYVDWIASGRARGYGRTTLLAIQNIQAGKSYKESGVNGSFGNGTAMRCAPFSVYFRNDLNALIEAATVDAKITHNSNEAVAGSLTIAIATYLIVNQFEDNLVADIYRHLPDSEVKNKLLLLSSMVNSSATPAEILKILGTRADVRCSVPVAMYLYLKFRNEEDAYRKAVVAAIMGGFDSDTNAAITGSLFGAKLGIGGIPQEWSDKIEDRDKLIILDAQLFNKNNQNYFLLK